ncbi:hypothetical protein CMUS01_05231 [Colletotrichum musicola]|uniref:Uncharacterized protein n=1 Tax=Colletotrichum musicola TaxID=2175873 RepID=A0A8H6KSJ4_9PEZI|nr:hypothetical protein CMUS01_05231 [Colletotrichum musicola]
MKSFVALVALVLATAVSGTPGVPAELQKRCIEIPPKPCDFPAKNCLTKCGDLGTCGCDFEGECLCMP